jgi:hypothetical protein
VKTGGIKVGLLSTRRRLLTRGQHQDQSALDKLTTIIYDELRRLGSSRPHDPTSRSAEPQPLLKNLAGIFGKSHRGGHVLCRRQKASAGVFTAGRGGQKAVHIAVAGHADAYDLPAGIDGIREQHK